MSHSRVGERAALHLGRMETSDQNGLLQLTTEADLVTSYADYSKLEEKILRRENLSLISDEEANTLRRKMRESWSRQIIQKILAVSHTDLGTDTALSTLKEINTGEAEDFFRITTSDEVNALAIKNALNKKTAEITATILPSSSNL